MEHCNTACSGLKVSWVPEGLDCQLGTMGTAPMAYKKGLGPKSLV